MGDVEIFGYCDPRFEQVKQAFRGNFEEGLEIGASFAVIVNGEYVIDIWGGYKDKKKTRQWEKDTICNVYSTTKIPTMLCTMMCVDRGLLDLDEKVMTYWPEFGKNGKENVLVRHFLSHSAGLAGIEKIAPFSVYYDWKKITGLLAAQKPWWEPGTKSGYHAYTQGYLLGELVRRVSGKSLGTFFKDEIATPLHLDFHIGLAEEHIPRVAKLVPSPPSTEDILPVLGAISTLTAGSTEIQALIKGLEKIFVFNIGREELITGVIKNGQIEFRAGSEDHPDCKFIAAKGHSDVIMWLFSTTDEDSEYVTEHLTITGSPKDVGLLKKFFEIIAEEVRKRGLIEFKMRINPSSVRDYSGDYEWQTAEIPAANGHGNARSVAKIASIIACGGELDGTRFLSAETLEKILEEQFNGIDLVLGTPVRWGLGVGLPHESRPHVHPRTAYWSGMGGSAIVMDLDAKMGIAYVMNQMRTQTQAECTENLYHDDTRGNRLITAVLESQGYI